MRKLTCSTLLAIALFALSSTPSFALSLVYQIFPNDTLELVPGQSMGGEIFVRTDSLERAAFMSLIYNFNMFRDDAGAHTWASEPACGVSDINLQQQGAYRLYWQDMGNLCGIDGFHLNTYYFENILPAGSQGMLTGQSLATVVSADTGSFWYESTAGGFVVPIISYDAVRGDVSGAVEDGNAFSWCDIEIADSIWRNGGELGNTSTSTGINIARAISYWPWPTVGDVTFMALAQQQPNHPYVRNIGYGQLFSTPRQGITSVPATPDLIGQTLYISTNGSMVMALAVRPNGSIWAQSGSTQGGVATFTDVPEGITVEQIVVQAITIDGVTEVDPFELPALPSQVELGQNYPNPFNPATTVPFDLQVPANVTLTVYDQLGRQVATLAQGPYQAGRHEVRFNAADLPTGMYFAQLRAGHATSTKKMLLIK